MKWVLDEYGALNLRFMGPHGEVHAFIALRAPYCDRGRFEFNVQLGVPGLDGADRFPRYFMSLDTAIKEAESWLLWRLYKKYDAGHDPRIQMLIAQDCPVTVQFPEAKDEEQ